MRHLTAFIVTPTTESLVTVHGRPYAYRPSVATRRHFVVHHRAYEPCRRCHLSHFHHCRANNGEYTIGCFRMPVIIYVHGQAATMLVISSALPTMPIYVISIISFIIILPRLLISLPESAARRRRSALPELIFRQFYRCFSQRDTSRTVLLYAGVDAGCHSPFQYYAVAPSAAQFFAMVYLPLLLAWFRLVVWC